MIKENLYNLLILFIAGCSVPSTYNHSYVSKGIKERTNYELGHISESGEVNLPEMVSLEDGLSQDEAVAVALWNNAQFQADLASLGFARADLIEANMLTNPTFSILFPISPRTLETSLEIPIDVLWQRPRRIGAAMLDAQSLSENLIVHGLGLIRDVQTAYADLWLSQELIYLALEDTQIQIQIAELSQARLRAGDISELSAQADYIDSLRAADSIKRLSKQATISRQQFDALLGLISDNTEFDIEPLDIAPMSEVSIDKLIETAFISRPDLRAAELAIEAAGERVGWEKSKIYNFIAIIDAEDEGEDFLSAAPGFAVEIPIFDQNKGKIARAKAELEYAARQYEALRQKIILQVEQAYTQYNSAHDEFNLWSIDIVPSLEKTVELTRNSFKLGQVSYLTFLKAEQKLVKARIRLAELTADLHRSAAELNYCIGKTMI